MKLPIWNSLPPRRRKLALWALGLLLFYTVVGFLILPPIVRSVAVKQLSKQLDREVSIEKIKINPFAFSITVRGLLIKDHDGQPFVSWDEAYVNFQLSSLVAKAWTFKEISTSKPFVRVQMNWDSSLNFSDLITKFSSTNATPTPKAAAAKPLVLHIERLHLRGVSASLADFTTRETFKRAIGPLDIALDDFRTDSDNRNPYAFTGTTDAGERISWSGFFYLDPIRSQGSLTFDNLTLNKYAPLYQDLVRFQIRDGSLGLHLNYRFELNVGNRMVQITNTAFVLRNFKLGLPGESNNLAELPHFGINGVSVDLEKRQATIGSIVAADGNVFLKRDQHESINLAEISRPPTTAANVSGGIIFMLRSVTNAVALLLQSTTNWSGTVQSVDITNCALHLEDLVNSRPARLDLTDIRLLAKNISNLPGTNLTADLSLRWNTNGFIKTLTTASFLPTTAELQLDLDQLDLGTLDPYLEPKLNLYILGSKLGLHGKINLATPPDALPQVTFHGDVNLDEFKTVDGELAEDLLKWDSLRFMNIAANLNPPTVAIQEIAVDNAYARLVIETNRSINLLNALRMTNAPATTEINVAADKTVPTTNSPLPQISVRAITISNALVSFTDRSLTPDVNLALKEVNGYVAGISSEQLQPAAVNLRAMVDGAGPVTITGLINPFNSAQTNTIKISLKDMDLTPASPYAAKFAGYRIAQGKLNLDLTYTIVGKKLSSKNVITLDRFSFGEKNESAEATKLPVRLAIAILKDRDGKIVLDVPIEGQTDDPKFRVSRVLWGALENILLKVATSPFSLLGAAFGGGEEMGYQDFAPGHAVLSDDGKKKLDLLLKAMRERPSLELEINGSIDPDGDREGLQRAALDQQIRAALWLKLSKSERATNAVDQIVIPPGDRASWVKKFYDAARTDNKISLEFLAANTNLAVFAAQVLPNKLKNEKGICQLMQKNQADSAKKLSVPAYQTKLVPPPDAFEAMLLATLPAGTEELEALAAARAKVVQDYLLRSGQVEAARLFLNSGGTLRRDGSRAYLQFR